MLWSNCRLLRVNAARLILGLTLLALTSSRSIAQPPTSKGQPVPLPLTVRESLARPLLLNAESASVAFKPDFRSFLLYRLAGAWLALEPARAVRLYRESFAAARQSATWRPYLEEIILNDLLPLSPSDVLDLLPDAENAIQTQIYAATINFTLLQGDYPAASQSFERAIAAGVLPLRATAHLLGSLPASAERTRIFEAATRYYQSHPNLTGFQWTLADLVVRFYAQLPRAQVLQAVEVVLTEAEQRERLHPGGGVDIGFGDNTISFNSGYDFQLFAVAPVLQQLDPARAARLLAEHGKVSADLKRYPRGLPSLDIIGFYPGKDALSPTRTKPTGLQLYSAIEDAQSLSALDMGLEFTVPRNLSILGVTGSVVFFTNPGDPEAAILDQSGPCPPEVPRRLELARSIPIVRKIASTCDGLGATRCGYTDTFPRARLIQAIAERCTYYGDPTAAVMALRDQLDLLGQMPPEERISYLATTADLYLRLGDRESAGRAVEKGFAAAQEIYVGELKSAKLSKVPKAFWYLAEAYRRMATLGVNVSIEATRKVIERIPDADLRELERVMIARALLGVPVRRYITANMNGAIGVGEVETTYDQF